MRVPEDSASTSCAIMSEEKSLNGLESDGCNSKKVQSSDHDHSPSNECCDQSYGSSGGRLKFFKDGKFILELSHRRDGEKMSWIAVPKKTYWPPPVTSTVTTSVRQESTASLSVSDDNSSAQLSPWQRDHCWKQASPRKAASLEMTFLMIPLPRAFQIRKTNSLTIKRKRRRPFDLIEKVINCKTLTNLNGFQRPSKVKNCAIKNGELNSLVDRLWDCVKSSENVHSIQKHSPSMFSPRKRILREFEKVSLVAGSTTSTTTAATTTGVATAATTTGAATTTTTTTATTVEEQSQLHLKRQRPKSSSNGQTLAQSNSKGVSSYSITSLLGTKDDHEPSFLRTLLRSPKDETSPEPSPKSRRNSPSQNVQCSSPPSESPVRGGGGGGGTGTTFPSVQFPYIHSPLLYPPFIPHQSNVSPQHPYFAVPSPYRNNSNALWGVPYHPLSSPLHPGMYQDLVSPYPSQFNYWHPQSSSSENKREDNISDVPLNLSKHPG